MTTYTSVEFMTAKEKEGIEKAWHRFMKYLASGDHRKYNETAEGSDYGTQAPKEFSKALYLHLSLHCGYIAHYNQHGFYDTYFTGGEEDLTRFFRNFEKTEWGGYPSASAWGDYEDIGKVMCDTYANYKDKIFTIAKTEDNSKFELIKEIVKRAETDEELKKLVIAKLL
jgi:hypothetical protein